VPSTSNEHSEDAQESATDQFKADDAQGGAHDLQAASRNEEAQTHRTINVSPDDVIQPDRRPWRRVSLDNIVVRAVAGSAATLAALLGLAFLVWKILQG